MKYRVRKRETQTQKPGWAISEPAVMGERWRYLLSSDPDLVAAFSGGDVAYSGGDVAVPVYF